MNYFLQRNLKQIAITSVLISNDGFMILSIVLEESA